MAHSRKQTLPTDTFSYDTHQQARLVSLAQLTAGGSLCLLRGHGPCLPPVMLVRRLLGPRSQGLRVLPKRQPWQGMCGEMQHSGGVRRYFVLVKKKKRQDWFYKFIVIQFESCFLPFPLFFFLLPGCLVCWQLLITKGNEQTLFIT